MTKISGKRLQNDAILVLNCDRRKVKNFTGGTTLLEIGFARVPG